MATSIKKTEKDNTALVEQVLSEVLTTLKSAKNIAHKELPVIATELVNRDIKMQKYDMMVSTSLLVLIFNFFIMSTVYFLKHYSIFSENNTPFNVTFPFFISSLSTIVFGLSTFSIITSIIDSMKRIVYIQSAPKLYVIEQISKLLRK